MKRFYQITVYCLTVALLFLSISCAPPKDAEAVRNIVDSIPLPPQTRYSIISGQRLTLEKPNIGLSYYNPDTGNSTWKITIIASEPNWWRRINGNHDWQEYVLCIPDFYPNIGMFPNNSDNNYWGMEKDKTLFTLSELREYRNRLAWK